MTSRSAILGWALVAGQLALLGSLVLEALRNARARPAMRAAGLLVVATGGAIAVLGGARLGSQLRARPAPPSTAVLRTDGPYRHVRHPIYSGLLLLAAGMAVAAGTANAAASLGGLIALLSFKARLEERLLAARFAEYAAYARRTPRFVPRPFGRG